LRGIEESHANAKIRGEIDSRLRCTCSKEIFGNGKQEAGAIAAQSIGIHTTTVRQAADGDERALDNFTRARAAQLGYEPNTTSIVVHRGVGVESAHST
jgi:hypothetical protein